MLIAFPSSSRTTRKRLETASGAQASRTPSAAMRSDLVWPVGGSAATTAATWLESHNNATVGPLPDNHPHHAPAANTGIERLTGVGHHRQTTLLMDAIVGRPSEQ